MSLGKDIIDIYTKSSVYYLRLQYLVVCYLIVLAGAFFVLPIPRTLDMPANARLIVGIMIYISFVVILIVAPELLKSSIGKLLLPDEYEEKIKDKFEQLSENEQIELEEEILKQSKIKMKITAQKSFVFMNKKQKIATNIFFQCLLIELFCLAIFINKDQSLLISNSVTQHIADILQTYTTSTPPYKDAFFTISNITTNETGSPNYTPFSQYVYMAQSIFFIYIIFVISGFVRLFSMFIFTRPILGKEDVFPVIKNAKTTKKKIWALLGTLIMLFVGFGMPIMFLQNLELFIIQIIDFGNWIKMSVVFFTVGMINVLISWRFIEDWYKLIFNKF